MNLSLRTLEDELNQTSIWFNKPGVKIISGQKEMLLSTCEEILNGERIRGDKLDKYKAYISGMKVPIKGFKTFNKMNENTCRLMQWLLDNPNTVDLGKEKKRLVGIIARIKNTPELASVEEWNLQEGIAEEDE